MKTVAAMADFVAIRRSASLSCLRSGCGARPSALETIASVAHRSAE